MSHTHNTHKYKYKPICSIEQLWPPLYHHVYPGKVQSQRLTFPCDFYHYRKSCNTILHFKIMQCFKSKRCFRVHGAFTSLQLVKSNVIFFSQDCTMAVGGSCVLPGKLYRVAKQDAMCIITIGMKFGTLEIHVNPSEKNCFVIISYLGECRGNTEKLQAVALNVKVTYKPPFL